MAYLRGSCYVDLTECVACDGHFLSPDSCVFGEKSQPNVCVLFLYPRELFLTKTHKNRCFGPKLFDVL